MDQFIDISYYTPESIEADEDEDGAVVMTASPPTEEDSAASAVVALSEQQTIDAPPGRWRCYGTYFAVTWSRCPETWEQMIRVLMPKWSSDVEILVVSQEKHQDGGLHYHAFFKFKSRKNFKSPFTFDLVMEPGKEYHANYKVANQPEGWMKYVLKEKEWKVLVGPEGFDPTKYVMRGKAKSGALVPNARVNGMAAEVARLLMEGATPRSILDSHPGFFLKEKKKIYDLADMLLTERLFKESLGYEALLARIDEGLRDPKWTSHEMMRYNASAAATVIGWLKENLKFDRVPRTKQLYLHGDPNIGKSRTVAQLRQYIRLWEVPKNTEYYDGYQNGCYHMAYIDEFAGQHTMTWLNSFLDGNPLFLNQKYGGVTKTDVLPVMIMSNMTPAEIYQKSLNNQENVKARPSFDALVSRLIVVNVDEESMEFVSRILGWLS